jgi:hypothetical protein
MFLEVEGREVLAVTLSVGSWTQARGWELLSDVEASEIAWTGALLQSLPLV